MDVSIIFSATGLHLKTIDMNDINAENENKAFARNLSHKFEYYLIALTFTILGLSVQTSSLSAEHFQYVFEFLAWISLLLSGLFGLWRFEYVPVVYREYGQQQIEETNLDAFNQGLAGRSIVKQNGAEWLPEEMKRAKEALEVNIAERKDKLGELESSIHLRYKIHRWAFIIGVVSLVISRGILGIDKIQMHSENVAPLKSENLVFPQKQ
ncbi:MAG: hypothetical protein ABSE81_01960 [Candidatus Omnitrophota bacterium]|jgi:hypothetical protein